MSSLCDKWMVILKGRFHRFQLSNRHFKRHTNFIKDFFFSFRSFKMRIFILLMENESLKN